MPPTHGSRTKYKYETGMPAWYRRFVAKRNYNAALQHYLHHSPWSVPIESAAGSGLDSRLSLGATVKLVVRRKPGNKFRVQLYLRSRRACDVEIITFFGLLPAPELNRLRRRLEIKRPKGMIDVEASRFLTKRSELLLCKAAGQKVKLQFRLTIGKRSFISHSLMRREIKSFLRWI